MSKFAYHVTPRANLVSIRQKGLHPSSHALSKDGQSDFHSGVMMYDTADEAKKAASHTTNVFWKADAVVILAVNIEGYLTIERPNHQLLVCAQAPIDQACVHVAQVLVHYHSKKDGEDELVHIQV